jgi:hypothetical protein
MFTSFLIATFYRCHCLHYAVLVYEPIPLQVFNIPVGMTEAEAIAAIQSRIAAGGPGRLEIVWARLRCA